MKYRLSTLTIILTYFALTFAYIDTLEDCLKVASKFSNTCKSLTSAPGWNSTFPFETI